jgi:hypothetical protein
MATITVKDIPGDLYEHLKQSARVNRRSINSEVIVCLERALSSSRIDTEAVLARARMLRERTAGYTINDREFTEAKAAGRP